MKTIKVFDEAGNEVAMIKVEGYLLLYIRNNNIESIANIPTSALIPNLLKLVAKQFEPK